MSTIDDDATQVTPDLDDLLQVDTLMTTVPVRITDPASFWSLPNRRCRTDEETVGDGSTATGWTQVVDGSKKRSSAILIASGNPIRIRTSTSGQGLLWPVGLPYPIRHTQAVFVICATPAATSVVGIVEEYWAD